MFRQGRLVDPDGAESCVDLHTVAGDPKLASLLTHDSKPLTYLRQSNVDVAPTLGTVVLPPVTIEGSAGGVA